MHTVLVSVCLRFRVRPPDVRIYFMASRDVMFKLRHLSFAVALCREARLVVVPVAVELNSEHCSLLTKNRFASIHCSSTYLAAVFHAGKITKCRAISGRVVQGSVNCTGRIRACSRRFDVQLASARTMRKKLVYLFIGGDRL